MFYCAVANRRQPNLYILLYSTIYSIGQGGAAVGWFTFKSAVFSDSEPLLREATYKRILRNTYMWLTLFLSVCTAIGIFLSAIESTNTVSMTSQFCGGD